MWTHPGHAGLGWVGQGLSKTEYFDDLALPIVKTLLHYSSAKTMKPLSDKEHLNCVRAFANKLQIARASVTHVVCCTPTIYMEISSKH